MPEDRAPYGENGIGKEDVVEKIAALKGHVMEMLDILPSRMDPLSMFKGHLGSLYDVLDVVDKKIVSLLTMIRPFVRFIPKGKKEE